MSLKNEPSSQLVAGLNTAAVVLLATNSNASFTAIADLVDADTVHSMYAYIYIYIYI